jgi:hypothetical protein
MNPFRREAVEGRRIYLAAMKTYVRPANVVGYHDDDIGSFSDRRITGQ